MAYIEIEILLAIERRLTRLEQIGKHQSSRLGVIEAELKAMHNGNRSTQPKTLAEYFRPIVQGGVNWVLTLLTVSYILKGGDLSQLIQNLLKLSG